MLNSNYFNNNARLYHYLNNNVGLHYLIIMSGPIIILIIDVRSQYRFNNSGGLPSYLNNNAKIQ